LAGTAVTELALPLTAVLVLSAGPAEMGLLVAAQTIPPLLFGLIIGAWIDRVSRRNVMIAADIGRLVLLIGIPIAAYLGALRMPQLYVTAFGLGTFSVFGGLASVAFLPALAGRDYLIGANSRLATSDALAKIAGPSLGGVLVQMFSAPLALLADALSYLVSAMCLALLGGFERPAEAKPEVSASLVGQIRHGLAFVFGQPILRTLAATAGTANFFASLALAVYVLFATQILGFGAAQLGLIYGFGSLGGLVGAGCAGPVSRRLGIGPTMLLATVFFALGMLLVPFAMGPSLIPLAVLAGSRFLTGLQAPMFNVTLVSLRQALTPDHLQGRVNATARVIAVGASPLGAALGGFAGGLFGVRATLLIAGAGAVLAVLLLVLSPVRGLRRAPEDAV
jgi:MFS family permease